MLMHEKILITVRSFLCRSGDSVTQSCARVEHSDPMKIVEGGSRLGALQVE